MRPRQSSDMSSNAFPAILIRLLVSFAAMNATMNLFLLEPLEKKLQKWEDYRFSYHDISAVEGSKPFTAATSLEDQAGRHRILDMFKEAGVNLTEEMESALPTWSRVQEVVGTHPYILGLETCQAFRDKVPAVERMLGSAGMFNTGTNLVTHLLKQNCEIPERVEKYGPHQSKESYGMRWQVQWGKHTPAKFRVLHTTNKAGKLNKEYMLPIVTIRDPYSWFKSMCKNGYAAKWPHGKEPPNCPKLKTDNDKWNAVNLRYGQERLDSHLSLAHLWNDWYRYYVGDADYPFVVVRMEDLVFYPKETIYQVCECAGGKIRTDKPFSYIVTSAKADSPGHDKSTGIYQAWIKYSQPPLAMGGFSKDDYQYSMEALNETLMHSLGYEHPPPS